MKPGFRTLICFRRVKRLNQQKKAKERERKDIESLGRKHLLNVRIVQRNQVYVVGLGQRLAKEEVRIIPARRWSIQLIHAVHTISAVQRVLWAVRQDFKDPARQA